MTAFPASVPCAVCELLPAGAGDIFCARCRSHATAMIDWPFLLRLSGRWLLAIGMEALLGLFTGFLLIMPIGAASSSQITLKEVVLGFMMLLLVMAPIPASLYAWTLKSWIQRSSAWAIANTIGALSLGVLMLLAVLAGLRLTTLPDYLLLLIVIALEGGIGITVARWQSRLLCQPFQRVEMWLRWSLSGWICACVIHLMLGLLIPGGGGLWLFTGLSFFVYGVVAHYVLARFAADAHMAGVLRRTIRAGRL